MEKIKRILIASGYVLSAIGLLLSFIQMQIPSESSYCMLSVSPFFFTGRLVTLAGLVVMGLGFMYSPRKTATNGAAIQQLQEA